MHAYADGNEGGVTAPAVFKGTHDVPGPESVTLLHSAHHRRIGHAEGGASSSAALECVQHGGDALFVPALWGHATLNLRPSIGCAYEFMTEAFCME